MDQTASIRSESSAIIPFATQQCPISRPQWLGREMERSRFTAIQQWQASQTEPRSENVCHLTSALQWKTIATAQQTAPYIQQHHESPTKDEVNKEESALTISLDQFKISEHYSPLHAAASPSLAEAATRKEAVEQPRRSAVITLLQELKGREITAKFEYISQSFNSGFASFCPEASPYCFQVIFQSGLKKRGISYDELRNEYIIRGELDFDEQEMKQYVQSMPAENFLEERLQHNRSNPLYIKQSTLKIIKKSDNGSNAFAGLPLETRRQKAVYKTFHSLYNRELPAKIICLHKKPTLQNPIFGDAYVMLGISSFFFIRFKIPPERITPEVLMCLHTPNPFIQGNLSYNYKWLISKIITNTPLLHYSLPEKPPRENQIFFAPSSISVFRTPVLIAEPQNQSPY